MKPPAALTECGGRFRKIHNRLYCAGALVAAGAFVDGISGAAGGVADEVCFWQPAINPKPISPSIATNDNFFFIGD